MITYNTPIEVTEQKCRQLRKQFAGIIAWRFDEERYYIKALSMCYVSFLEGALC